MTAELTVLLLPIVLIPGRALELDLPGHWLGLLRERAQHDLGFGVCLNTAATGGAPTAAPVGTQAQVEDFEPHGPGGVRLRLRGGRRFQILELRPGQTLAVAPRALVRWRDSRHEEEIDSALGLLRTLIEARDGPQGLAEARFDDPDWVSWQFVLLDQRMPPALRQQLLEEDVPMRRVLRVLDAFAHQPAPF